MRDCGSKGLPKVGPGIAGELWASVRTNDSRISEYFAPITVDCKEIIFACAFRTCGDPHDITSGSVDDSQDAVVNAGWREVGEIDGNFVCLFGSCSRTVCAENSAACNCTELASGAVLNEFLGILCD